MSSRIRYTVDKVLSNTFYQMPKFLFEGEFKALSNDARVLYMLLKDRHELSIKNKWYNAKGEVYLIMTRENMETILNLSAPTVRKVLKELKELKLIEEERQGLNKPNLLYLLECKNISIQSAKKLQSRVSKNYSQERQNVTQINTYPNETNLSNTNFINQSEVQVTNEVKSTPKETIDTIDNDTIKEKVKDNISLDYLQKNYPTKEKEIEELYELIVETLTSKKKSFRIAKEDLSAAIVKQAFINLTYDHMDYVVQSLKDNTTKVKNIKSYLLTTLYNAYKTSNNYYSLEVQHDLNKDLYSND